MSLNYDLTKIENYEERCTEVATETVSTFMRTHEKGATVLKPLTHTLVFLSMSVGLGRITEKNWRKWYGRARTIEALGGAWRTRVEDDGTHCPLFLTPEDVHSHIGLSTNVLPAESDAKWRKRIVESSIEDREREAAKWARATETEAA